MLLLCKLSILKEYRNKYPTKLSWLGQVLSELVMLTIYWYTAKAFLPNLQVLKSGVDYFSYIVVGESVLFLPSLLMTAFVRIFRSEVQQGTFEPTLLSIFSLQRSWLIQALGLVIVEGSRLLIVFTIAIGLFNLSVSSLPTLLAVFFLQILALPFFAGLGLLGAAMMIILGRGDRILVLLTTGMTVLAGAYFPANVLPLGLQSILHQISPMTILLDSTRAIFQGESSFELLIQSASFLLIGSLIFSILGLAAIRASIIFHRRRSRPLFFVS